MTLPWSLDPSTPRATTPDRRYASPAAPPQIRRRVHSDDLAAAAGLGRRVAALERSAAELTASGGSLAQVVTAAVGLGARVLSLERATADAALSRGAPAQGSSTRGAGLEARWEARMPAVERATLEGEAEEAGRRVGAAPRVMAGLQVRMLAAGEAPADAIATHRWGPGTGFRPSQGSCVARASESGACHVLAFEWGSGHDRPVAVSCVLPVR